LFAGEFRHRRSLELAVDDAVNQRLPFMVWENPHIRAQLLTPLPRLLAQEIDGTVHLGSRRRSDLSIRVAVPHQDEEDDAVVTIGCTTTSRASSLTRRRRRTTGAQSPSTSRAPATTVAPLTGEAR
jgi:hypothetical protein